LVLDLRNDPGGLLDAAVALSAAFFYPRNVAVVSTNGQLEEKASLCPELRPQFWRRGALRRATRFSDSLRNAQGLLEKIPLVVLVNEGLCSVTAQ
jgi:carboxyl-terminal processing protease